MHLNFLDTALCLRVAETLLRFLWQGFAIGLAMWAINALVAQDKSNLRYRINLFALLLMAACLPLTFALLPARESGSDRTTDAVPAVVSNTNQTTLDEIAPQESVEPPLDSPPAVPSESSGMVVEASPSAADKLPVTREPEDPVDDADADVKISNAWLSRIAPYATIVYLAGVMAMLLRLLLAVWGGQRLRRAAQKIEEPGLLANVESLARRLGLKVAPLVATCSRISGPVVVGILKPMILLPPTLVSSMSPAQLEAVLAHELAHLRRFDLLVNLLQRLIEAVLFFHPAVWYVSRRVSLERENSCDDLVMEHGCDRLTYADALLRMAEICTDGSRQRGLESAAALAASGSHPSEFKSRVLRVVGETDGPPLRLTRWGLAFLAALMMSFTALLAVMQIRSAGPQDPDWESLAGSSYQRDGTTVFGCYTDQEMIYTIIATAPDGYTSLTSRGEVKGDPERGNRLHMVEFKWGSTTLISEIGAADASVVRFAEFEKSKNSLDRQFSLQDGRVFYCDLSTGTIEQRQTLKGPLPQPPPIRHAKISATMQTMARRIEAKFAPDGTNSGKEHGSHDHDHSDDHSHEHHHSELTPEAQMKKVIGRFDADYWKTVDVPRLIADKQIAFSPDREVLALLRGQTLYAIESVSGHFQEYEVKENADLVEWKSGLIHLRTAGGEERFYAVRRPAILFLDSQNDPVSAGRLMEARIGLAAPRSNWMLYTHQPGDPMSLMGLKPGTHWLVTDSRDLFAVSLPLGSRDPNLPEEVILQGEVTERKTPSGTVREIRRRLQPQPTIQVDNVSATASVKQLGNGRELLSIEIRNNSGKRLQFSEQHIYLETEVEGRHERALSPYWTQDETETFWPQITIEDGAEGILELDWDRWRNRGIWFGGFVVTSDTKGLGPIEQIPGKLQGRVYGPGFRTRPVALSIPETEEPAERQPAAPSNPQSNAGDQTPPGNPAPEPIDATTLELYNRYIAKVGKIETASVRAAIELVAARGSGDKEFRELLRKDFVTSRQEDNQRYDSRKLLALIAAVLDREGGMRWQKEEEQRTGEIGQRQLPPGDALYRESPLLTDLIEYGRKCGRSEIDDFVFAVRQAHHPQGKQFLLDVLNNPSDPGNPFEGTDKTKGKWPDNVGGGWNEARFLAAVGLAELNVEEGVRWLIEHARPNDFGIGADLRKKCNGALHSLSGLQNKGEEYPVDWDNWWRENKDSFSPRRAYLKEPPGY